MKLEELTSNRNGDKEVIEILKKSKKPILVYGSANHAEMVLKYLAGEGVSVEAFVIDEVFYEKDFFINGLKVTTINNYVNTLEKYNVVIGFCDVEKSRFIVSNPCLFKTNFFLLWEPLETYIWSEEYLKENWGELLKVYNNLADVLSRKTLSNLIEAKLSFCGKELLKIADKNQYFNELTFCVDSSKEIFVDCGAFNGDTISKYVEFTNNDYKKIYAFEPNQNNIIALKKRTESIENIEIIEKGTWNEETVLEFRENGSASQIVENEGSVKVEVTTIDNIVGDDKVTFIKMDVEGSELESLEGAKQTIAKCFPKLAICCYHKRDDIVNLYNYINQFENDEYRYIFYLRHHSNSVYETVLYAIPVKKLV